MLDDAENGINIGSVDIGTDDGVYSGIVQSITGRHAVYFVAESVAGGWFKDMFSGRMLFELVSFMFAK
jgi:hypothetical protein